MQWSIGNFKVGARGLCGALVGSENRGGRAYLTYTIQSSQYQHISMVTKLQAKEKRRAWAVGSRGVVDREQRTSVAGCGRHFDRLGISTGYSQRAPVAVSEWWVVGVVVEMVHDVRISRFAKLACEKPRPHQAARPNIRSGETIDRCSLRQQEPPTSYNRDVFSRAALEPKSHDLDYMLLQRASNNRLFTCYQRLDSRKALSPSSRCMLFTYAALLRLGILHPWSSTGIIKKRTGR